MGDLVELHSFDCYIRIQQAFACSKLTIEIPEQGVKYVWS